MTCNHPWTEGDRCVTCLREENTRLKAKLAKVVEALRYEEDLDNLTPGPPDGPCAYCHYASYKLKDDSPWVWIEVGKFAVRIKHEHEGVVVDVYQNGHEDEGDSLTSCYVFNNDVEEEV